MTEFSKNQDLKEAKDQDEANDQQHLVEQSMVETFGQGIGSIGASNVQSQRAKDHQAPNTMTSEIQTGGIGRDQYMGDELLKDT